FIPDIETVQAQELIELLQTRYIAGGTEGGRTVTCMETRKLCGQNAKTPFLIFSYLEKLPSQGEALNSPKTSSPRPVTASNVA
ncbi:hypothetical protein, partial [Methylocaldum szegediense]